MLFRLNEEKNRGEKLEKVSFSQLNMDEVHHLQEIIANNTETLGEEFLIIQKEFRGFDDTNERLDLLALDKNGNLVVIENKLDDSGKDVTWQIIKYASYVSTFTRDQIVKIFQDYLNKEGGGENAEEKLKEFFEVEDFEEIILNEGNTSQRLILVAGNFRKEITSSVLWLINYGLNMQCIKATPYRNEKEVFVDMQQIIPVKDAEDFIIKLAEKEKDVEKSKRDLHETYTKDYHLNHLNNDIKNLFYELEDYVLEKTPFLKEYVRKYYIGFKLLKEDLNMNFYTRELNFFRVSFNVNSIHFSGARGHNLAKRIESLNHDLGTNFFPYYGDPLAEETDYGYFRIKIENKSDLEIAKRVIDYFSNKENIVKQLRLKNKISN